MNLNRIQKLLVLAVPDAKISDSSSSRLFVKYDFKYIVDIIEEITNIFRKEDDFLHFEIEEDDIKFKRMISGGSNGYYGFYLIDVQSMCAFYHDGIKIDISDLNSKLETIDSLLKGEENVRLDFPVIFLDQDYEIPNFLIELEKAMLNTNFGPYVSPGFKFNYKNYKVTRKNSISNSNPDFKSNELVFICVDDKKNLKVLSQKNEKVIDVIVNYDNFNKNLECVISNQFVTEEESKFVYK